MRTLLIWAASAASAVGYLCLAAPDDVSAVHTTAYHLTARPWKPLAIPLDRYLDAIEGECRFTVRHQDAAGAIIDPVLHREHQYATPYFAYAVGTLVEAGRAPELLANGVKAMEHSTQDVGAATVPDNHGEFFIPVLTEALELYAKHVPADTLARWRERMKKPLKSVLRGSFGNWETYAMKGEWLRSRSGLATHQGAVDFIEEAWRTHQRGRIAPLPWNLYHDRSSDPDTLSVEAVGRGNLLALTEAGYDGPSAAEIRQAAENGTQFALLLQDPSGQVPANGRTDDHVWVDIGYQLGFEVMAARLAESDPWRAGQFRHAAMLAFQSADRWRRTDAPWDGSYFVTKNRFDPALRVGYQLASQYSNYNGSLMFHLSEAYWAAARKVAEHPAPSEIGGSAFSTDGEFSSVFANAGGMQIQANLRGQLKESDGNLWTPLGLVRFARAGWDTRLGPSDGALTAEGGVSFAPTFKENGKWVRIADASSRYEGVWSVEFVHPLLVRCALEYRPRQGQSGPSFRDALVVTPDGVYSEMTKTSAEPVEWGVTWPLLVNDGHKLTASGTPFVRSVQYPGSEDQQNFIALDASPTMTDEPLLRGSYGDLLPVRVVTHGDVNRTFIYPRSGGQPDAETVRRSFRIGAHGFSSPLAIVEGKLYSGPNVEGGFGASIAFGAEGSQAVKFSQPCGFLIQLRNGRAVAIETDRAVKAHGLGRTLELSSYVPIDLDVEGSQVGR
jgi:hypothetical protein